MERKDGEKRGGDAEGFSRLTAHTAAFECRALASEECEEGTEVEREESRAGEGGREEGDADT